MGSLVGSCFGSCCATCGCEAAKCCTPSKGNTRVPYVILLFISTCVALILRFWGGPMLVHLYVTNINLCDTNKCVGFGAVFRISFALFFFFAVHCLLLLAKSCYKIDSGHWMIKLLMFAGLIVLSWFIPDTFFDVYTQIARVVSGIFLLLQIVILIDFAYSWNEDWVSEEKNWKAGVIIVSVTFFIASLILLIFMFKWFGGSGCELENFFISFTMICTLIFTIIQLFFSEKGGLLPSAVVSLYCHYLCFSSLSSDPHSCNTLNTSDEVHLIIALILAALSISYASYNLASSNSLFGGSGDEVDTNDDVLLARDPEPVSKDLEQPTGEKDKKKDKDKDEVEAAEPELDEETKAILASRYSKFHLIMAASAMYMAMMLTNWSTRQDADSTSTPDYDISLETMWIKIITQWVTIGLYTWSLIAPTLCKDREF